MDIMESRDEILANFQACTGIEDIAEAISLLDDNDWNLEAAVYKAIELNVRENKNNERDRINEVIEIADSPIETSTETIALGDNRNLTTTNLIGNNSNVTTKHSMSAPFLRYYLEHQQPSTSSLNNEPPKTLLFNVQYSDKVVPITVLENETLADIKMKIYKEFKVPPCKQLLSGWARMTSYEKTPLKQMMLPQENALLLTVKNTDGLTKDDVKITERLSNNFLLKIRDLTNKHTYDLPFAGTKTILDVKTELYTITKITLRQQVWNGWPSNVDDNTVLALSGINYPEHELTLEKGNKSRDNEVGSNATTTTSSHTPTTTTNSSISTSTTNVINMESDDEEFEDASETFGMDDYFVDNVSSQRIEPLISETIEDDIVGSIQFSEQFTQRYGQTHPTFFVGTLEDALKEACHKPTKDRKILGLYLHHDNSVLSNVFCTQLLGSENVIQLLDNNFVFWGWDLTFQSNKSRLYRALTQNLGNKITSSLWNIPTNKLPAIIVIMKNRSNIIVYTVVYGNVGVNDLLSRLVEVVEVFNDNQRTEIQEEQERAERELVKWEQDMAYNQSLEADRAKEELKRQQAEAELNERKRLEYEIELEKQRKEAHRLQVEANLPPEPSQDQADITKIRFRLPLGNHLERRFYTTTPLKVLLDYLVVQGYPTDEYKAISSWPRRDLTVLDVTKTLEELKLCPQETVILEQR